MEAALFVVDLTVLLLLIFWSLGRERASPRVRVLRLFDYTPGAECDDGPKARPPVALRR